MRTPGAFVVVLLLLGGCLCFALTSGQYDLPLQTVFQLIRLKLTACSVPEELATPAMVLWSVRLPRVLMALLAGAALAVGGVVFQGVMKNPLVSPSFLGVTHGAVFGASLAIIYFGNVALTIEGSAFFWAVAAVAIVYAIGGRGVNNLTTLVIAGVIVSTFFMAASSFLKYIADPYEQLPAIVFWTMGGLNNVLWHHVVRGALIILAGIAVIMSFPGRLDMMALGDEEALSLGVNVRLMRLVFMLAATLIVASSSSSCGIIMWVDLIVAHLSRMIIGPDHGRLLPFAALTGALFLLFTDTIVRLLPGGEVPISIVTSFIGAPLLGYLLIKQNQSWKQ